MLASNITVPNEESGGPLVAPGQLMPFSLVTSLFFMWGVPNNLNDVLIRQFMTSFTLNRVEAGLVQSAFYLGYFILAIPAALIMRRRGYKTGLVIGLLLYASGAILFWPAAVAGRYSFFLAALFVIASGLSFLETASNPFITQMGSPATAARRLNFSQAFNTLGSIAGVLAGTIFIFSGVELNATQITAQKAAGTYAAYLKHETMRVVAPYLVLGCIALTLAIVFMRTKFPEVAADAEERTVHAGNQGVGALFGRPHFLLAVLAQFLYVGAQVGTWSYFIQYVQDYTHQPEKHAGLFLTGTLVAFAVGRFSAPLLMKRIAAARLMLLYAVANALLLVYAVLQPGWAGMWAVFLTSFFMSIMFPTIFALGLEGLGPLVKLGGSLLVMAIVGGAALTPIMGWISQHGGIARAYTVPLFSYLVIAWFGWYHTRRSAVRLAAHSD
ncbi:MAG TPA: L-fucose:H+ symporter permease [Acidobacteriaceae bacterium]|jgi:FHS family L-fucose permease-like MFS transporter|nr:L-fucose:H+ symporter permease [Acidobacteriaceae bacterium]